MLAAARRKDYASGMTQSENGYEIAPVLLERAGRVREFERVDAAIFSEQIQPRGEPAIMRGLVSDWPLVEAGRQGAAGFLEALKAEGASRQVDVFRAPAALKGRYFYSQDYRSFNFERDRIGFDALLDELEAKSGEAAPDGVYAGAVQLVEDLAGLAGRLPMLLLDDGVERLTSLWIGTRGRTAPHWDLPQNLACVLTGRRRFTLFPTEQIPNLYIGPLDFTLAGQPVSCVDLADPDLERFPRFAEAMDHALIAELEPGDALYLPSLHVHHVEARDPVSAMVNFWWRDGPDHLVTPFLTLLHGLLTLRDMPEKERLAWRTLFDAYLFQTEGDPMAHLPDDARGVFGPATPENLTRIKRHLIQTLSR